MLGTGDFIYHDTYLSHERREYLAEILLKDSEIMSSFCIFCGELHTSSCSVSNCGSHKKKKKKKKNRKNKVLSRLCTELINKKLTSKKERNINLA